ncbi:MAG: hypothetical protein IPP32_16310 [Bacteroidetes bacterium]|nr:hypothetical protein [Bacteroidota bacterium]
MLISSSGSIQSSHEISATTPLASSHFYGDASWYSIIGAGNKVKVYAAY